MGTATVTENQGDGLYKIKLSDETAGILAEIADKQAVVADIENNLLPAATAEYNTSLADYNAEHTALQSLISELKTLQATGGSTSEITAKIAEIKTKTPEVLNLDRIKNQKNRAVSWMNIDKMNAQAEVDRWQAMYDTIEDDIRDAWCVDYTDSLAVGDTVGLAEINSEPKGTVNIYAGGAETPGVSTPAIALGPATLYNSKALKPGWQKWQPTYRIGIITELDGDICDVALLPATSTEQGLDINQEGIVYPLPGENTVPGWDDFAERYPDFALTSNGDLEIPNTPELMADLKRINAEVNSNEYRLDQDQYGKLDHWDFMQPGGSGDCEDYALTKAKMLLDLGYSADAIHIEVGISVSGVGHAWLVIQTDAGDIALDLNYPNPMPNGMLPYSDRLRQYGMDWRVIGVLLEDVPIEYMDGVNGSAFLVNDRVVVKFVNQDWEQPVVIGFETNPRVAGNYFVFYMSEGVARIATIAITDAVAVKSTDMAASDVGITGISADIKIFCHSKRFTHSVEMLDGSFEDRELYFVAMSIRLTANRLSGGGEALGYDSGGNPVCDLYIYDPSTALFYVVRRDGGMPYFFNNDKYASENHSSFWGFMQNTKTTVNFSSDSSLIFYTNNLSLYAVNVKETAVGIYALMSVSSRKIPGYFISDGFGKVGPRQIYPVNVVYVDRAGDVYFHARDWYYGRQHQHTYKQNILSGARTFVSLIVWDIASIMDYNFPGITTYSGVAYTEVASPDGFFTADFKDKTYTLNVVTHNEGEPNEYNDLTRTDSMATSPQSDFYYFKSGATTLDLYGEYNLPIGTLLNISIGNPFYEQVVYNYVAGVYTCDFFTPNGEKIFSASGYQYLDNKKAVPWFHLQSDWLINGLLVADRLSPGSRGTGLYADIISYNTSTTFQIARAYKDGSRIENKIAAALGVSESAVLGLVMAPKASLV